LAMQFMARNRVRMLQFLSRRRWMQMRKGRSLLVAPALATVLAMGCASGPSDAQLTTNLKAQMFSDPQTKIANLQVAVKGGVVTLSGAVPNDAARYEAYKIASTMPGVRKINDQMTVAAPQAVAEASPPPAAVPAVKTPPRPKAKLTRAELRRERKNKNKNEKRPHHAAATERTEKAAAQPPPPPPPTETATPAVQQVATTPQSATMPTQASAAPPSTSAAQSAPPPPPPPVTAVFPAGTAIEIQTVDSIDSTTAQAGDQFQATLALPLTWDGRVVVPAGANVYLRLVAADTSGQYKGRSELQLRLARLEFQGVDYALNSTTYTEAGNSRGKNTAEKVGGGAVLGAIIGALAGGGKGAAIGGAAGAGAGGVYQGVTKAKQVRIPSETKLDFKLDQPLDIPMPSGGAH
jgi:BON domain